MAVVQLIVKEIDRSQGQQKQLIVRETDRSQGQQEETTDEMKDKMDVNCQNQKSARMLFVGLLAKFKDLQGSMTLFYR